MLCPWILSSRESSGWVSLIVAEVAATEEDSSGSYSVLSSSVLQTRITVLRSRMTQRGLLAAVVLVATLLARGTAQLSCKLWRQHFSGLTCIINSSWNWCAV